MHIDPLTDRPAQYPLLLVVFDDEPPSFGQVVQPHHISDNRTYPAAVSAQITFNIHTLT